jgi:hypothetical protein
MCRMRRNRRVRRRRSARREKRGVKSVQGFGVAKLGTDGPARRSRWLSPAWWTGPPPIPRGVPPRATNRMTRPPRRSLTQEAARGFWIRAWGQRRPALQGTGHSNSPVQWLGLLEGGLGADSPAHRGRDGNSGTHQAPSIHKLDGAYQCTATLVLPRATCRWTDGSAVIRVCDWSRRGRRGAAFPTGWFLQRRGPCRSSASQFGG